MKHPSMKVLSILVMIVIMKQAVCNTWVDTAREPMTMDLFVKNVLLHLLLPNVLSYIMGSVPQIKRIYGTCVTNLI